MQMNFRSWAVLGAAAALVALAACGSDSNKKPEVQGFPQPANTVALNFSIDDSGQTYTSGQLRWKGSFSYDATTRMFTPGTSWCEGTDCIELFDDGPYTAGGHEPPGSVAGDHKWGITAFMTVPQAETTIDYGAINEDGWIWVGDNGQIIVPAGQTAPMTATGMAIPGFGTTDLRITLDTTQLASDATYTAGDTVTIKGSFGAWKEVPMTGSGSTFTFVLGDNVGPGKAFVHSGLLKSGDIVEWVIVLHGSEYKSASDGGDAAVEGVTAELKPAGGAWTVQTIIRHGAYNNTAVSVP